MDCRDFQGKLPHFSPSVSKNSQCEATVQLKKKYFFGIYKVEPSGEWLLELTQDS